MSRLLQTISRLAVVVARVALAPTVRPVNLVPAASASIPVSAEANSCTVPVAVPVAMAGHLLYRLWQALPVAEVAPALAGINRPARLALRIEAAAAVVDLAHLAQAATAVPVSSSSSLAMLFRLRSALA